MNFNINHNFLIIRQPTPCKVGIKLGAVRFWVGWNLYLIKNEHDRTYQSKYNLLKRAACGTRGSSPI